MNSDDNQPVDQRARERYYILSGEEIDRLVLPLTVVHAYVQLLRRRIGTGQMSGVGEIDESLARMQVATQTMTDDLWAIMESTTHQ